MVVVLGTVDVSDGRLYEVVNKVVFVDLLVGRLETVVDVIFVVGFVNVAAAEVIVVVVAAGVVVDIGFADVLGGILVGAKVVGNGGQVKVAGRTIEW